MQKLSQRESVKEWLGYKRLHALMACPLIGLKDVPLHFSCEDIAGMSLSSINENYTQMAEKLLTILYTYKCAAEATMK